MQLFSRLDQDSDRSTFNILVVCTGNICRSPLGESLLRFELSRLPVLISSAGTHAMVGMPMHEPIQQIARDFGLTDEQGHRAQQVSAYNLKDSDLILVMDRGHRRHVAEMLPRASRYTFTIREFARLAEQVKSDDSFTLSEHTVVESLRNAVESVAQLRGSLPLLDDPSHEDVVDPYGEDQAIYKLSVGQLLPAIKVVTRLLYGAVGEIKLG